MSLCLHVIVPIRQSRSAECRVLLANLERLTDASVYKVCASHRVCPILAERKRAERERESDGCSLGNL